jgi:hypothetical protein
MREIPHAIVGKISQRRVGLDWAIVHRLITQHLDGFGTKLVIKIGALLSALASGAMKDSRPAIGIGSAADHRTANGLHWPSGRAINRSVIVLPAPPAHQQYRPSPKGAWFLQRHRPRRSSDQGLNVIRCRHFCSGLWMRTKL